MLGRFARIAAAGLLVTAGVAEACEVPTGFTARARLTSQDVVVAFRTVPAAIEIGRHFSVEAIVCATPPTQGLRVDAQMPEHRHGMNYQYVWDTPAPVGTEARPAPPLIKLVGVESHSNDTNPHVGAVRAAPLRRALTLGL